MDSGPVFCTLRDKGLNQGIPVLAVVAAMSCLAFFYFSVLRSVFLRIERSCVPDSLSVEAITNFALYQSVFVRAVAAIGAQRFCNPVDSII